jgi:hypothetical protein
MYNLLISLGVGAALYLVTALVAGSWVAGILPALIAAAVAYFLLARRTFKQFEAAATAAVSKLQQVQQNAQIIEEVKADLAAALPLGQWQFLIAEQVHGQIGQLAYMQANMRQSADHSEARGHLQKAWSRDWMSQLTLAVIEHRAKESAAALGRYDKAKGAGGGQAIFWAVFAFIARDSGDTDRALVILNEGLQKMPKNEPLTAWRAALANGKDLDLMAFGQPWFQFFPNHFTRLSPAQQQALMGGQLPPRPAAANGPPPGAPPPNRAQRRHGDKPAPAPGPKFPHPRR